MKRQTIMACAFSLAALTLGAGAVQALEAYRSHEVLSAPWGTEPGRFGILEQAEGVGPQSLSVDEQGNIYILDLVNRRVSIFTPQGDFLRQTACGILAHDLCLDEKGELYLLAPYHGLVERYDPQGNLLSRWPISQDIWLIDGMRVAGDEVIVRTVLQSEYTVVRAEEALAPEKQLAGARPGFGEADPSRRFQTQWVNDHLGLLRLLDGRGNRLQEIPVTTDQVLGSLVFVGTDRIGNVYLRAELLQEPAESRGRIFKFDLGGELSAEFTIPAADFTFIFRSLSLAPDGSIYQLLTGPEGIRVLRWFVTTGDGEGR